MIRDVDLNAYLPPIMQRYKEPMAALEAENPEFELVWDAVNRTLQNRFIETADEYGISRFEAMLGLFPEAEDTLESRRSRVRSAWFNRLPYTIRVLAQRLKVMCGDGGFILSNDFTEGYSLSITTNLEMYGQVEELDRLLKRMTPCNVVFDVENQVLCKASGTGLFGGGMVFCDEIELSNDFNETFTAEAPALQGGGMVFADLVEIKMH